jgi:hypothetical protein
MDKPPGIIDCACVIHGNAYSWQYVDCLYAMLRRNLTTEFNLHVYTEADRSVPEHMIKHELTEWPEIRSGRAWWYKMQLFNPAHHAGPLLYFDLDTVIVNNIDWAAISNANYFWSIRDYKYLWRSSSNGINSSVMYWDTRKYDYVWDKFCSEDIQEIQLKYRGDQDFLSEAIEVKHRRFFNLESVQSWRWQCLDGGYDFERRRHRVPGTGTSLGPQTSILVFHGRPKPSDVTDPVILQHWKI